MNRHFALVGVAIAVASSAPSTAAAQPVDQLIRILVDREARALAAIIAKRALRRGRRAFALGPYIGAGPAFATSGGDVDVHITGGLALTRYDIDIFVSPDRVADLIKARALELLMSRIGDRAPPSRDDLERLVARVIEDVKRELLLGLVPRRFERPGFKLALEIDHLFDAGAYEVRGIAGIGVSRVFLSTGLVIQADDGVGLVLPLELSVPMLLSSGLRSPAVEWFGRLDVAVTGRDERADRIVIGARLSLDVI